MISRYHFGYGKEKNDAYEQLNVYRKARFYLGYIGPPQGLRRVSGGISGRADLIKAAGLGVDVYRLNYSPETSEDFAYLDRVLDLRDANGLRLFLIPFDRKFTKDGLTPISFTTKPVPSPNDTKGGSRCIKISNEQDLACLDLVNFEGPDGDRPEHFVREDYLLAREAMRAYYERRAGWGSGG
ncbi:MAG: hypothetical protein ACLU9S_01670 [Oscillospiraceae bacterium]